MMELKTNFTVGILCYLKTSLTEHMHWSDEAMVKIYGKVAHVKWVGW